VGFLNRLFGSAPVSKKPYVDAGVELTHKLVSKLALEGWSGGLPQYTAEETEAINLNLGHFQRTANESAGTEVVFHPEFMTTIQRRLIAEGLEKLADGVWLFSDHELPEDWKSRISTYLKAWAGKLNPDVLLKTARLLALAGYKSEAKETLQVVLLFPSYANKYFGGSSTSAETAEMLVQDAQKLLGLL
jgi:hypothetical protein